MQQAVSGFAGLRITVVHSGHPVTLTAIAAERFDATKTSLGISLPLLSPAYEPGSRVVSYSTVAGALVDLAADLAYVVDRTQTRAADVELNVDLPPITSATMLTGLDDLTTLNCAAGVLIGQGQHPDTADQVLRSRAAVAGTTTLALANQLLDRVVDEADPTSQPNHGTKAVASPRPRHRHNTGPVRRPAELGDFPRNKSAG